MLEKFVIAAVIWVMAGASALGQAPRFGGSIRGYQFFRMEELPPLFDPGRRDLEFVSLRLTWEQEVTAGVGFEAHAVLDFLSPPLRRAAGVATGTGTVYLPLQTDFAESDDYRLEGRLDRFAFEVEQGRVRVRAGRQAITWGVAYFWPTLDLFSPFAPERIDRDYKSGVDALRATVALSAYSELQLVGAVLGPSPREDGAAGALLRLGLGRLDLGLMGGKFHGDTVAGVFVTTDAGGTALRGEVARTSSDDPFERRLGRGTFWRATLGVDRQLAPNWSATLELAYNGFGAASADGYPLLALTDRVRRGEISSFGKYYAGAAVGWQLHPLWTLSHAVLVNWQDPSALYIPTLNWSTSDNTSLLVAVQTGFGGEFEANLLPASEYGPVPTTVFAAFQWYF